MSARRLTSLERAAYDRDGFVVIHGLVPPGECADIDAEIRRVGQEQERSEEASLILQLGLRSPITRRICVDERLLDLVEELVAPGVAIYSAKMVAKIPGRPEFCHWHQDESYYRQNSVATRRLSAWLALHDSDAANGGVRFLPGSQRWGLQPYVHQKTGTCVQAITHITEEQRRQAVCPAVPVGSVVLFDSLTWHSSEPSTSTQVRRAFIVSYQDALAQGGNGEQWRIVRAASAQGVA